MKHVLFAILSAMLLCTTAFADEYPTVTFGSYEQDGDPENGPEPIEWLIVDENDDACLYVAKDGFENIPYNEEKAEISWKESGVREWMNGTFLDTSFTEAERERILLTTNTNEAKTVHDNVLWRLRTPGRTKGHAVVVLTTGEYDYCGLNVSYDLACIRPAMWVKK